MIQKMCLQLLVPKHENHEIMSLRVRVYVSLVICTFSFQDLHETYAAYAAFAPYVPGKVGMAEHVQFLWEKRVISMLSAWASELSEEAGPTCMPGVKRSSGVSGLAIFFNE